MTSINLKECSKTNCNQIRITNASLYSFKLTGVKIDIKAYVLYLKKPRKYYYNNIILSS